jgi:hypothetical protein
LADGSYGTVFKMDPAGNVTILHLDLNGEADVVIDFGAGIWIWTFRNNSTWVPLHGLAAKAIMLADRDGNGKDEIIIDFGPTYGLWQHANDSVWSQIHALSPLSLAVGRFYYQQPDRGVHGNLRDAAAVRGRAADHARGLPAPPHCYASPAQSPAGRVSFQQAPPDLLHLAAGDRE